ncbi:MAG TPA: type III-A CRISPR-associated RAMP protein Csm5 [Clostridiales bacterium]|nr:type III-A CRISPR-associated RAMP protein Csm5 [Clostridiales bacterium]
MIKDSHLEIYKLTLTTQSPVFVGSGQTIKKTEYCYYPEKKQAIILDDEKFLSFLVKENLIEKYEQFIFSNSGDLAKFLQSCGYGYDDVSNLMLYSTDVGDALDDIHSKKNIHCFIRNHKNQPYIPGSSLKGALRTALLVKMVLNEPYPYPIKVGNKNEQSDIIEKYYLNVLNLKENKKEILNDIMRTISISDSEPIDNSNMTLCSKHDIYPNGSQKKIAAVVRECVKPGIKINFILSIDKSFGRYISVDEILDAIAHFPMYYTNEYLRFFSGAKVGSVPPNSIYLGGGVGYFSKNIVYPLLGHSEAVKEVSNFMSRKFKGHKHFRAVKLGISPKRLKCTTFNNTRYQFGICSVEIT